jgi:hypothetical protein
MLKLKNATITTQEKKAHQGIIEFLKKILSPSPLSLTQAFSLT